MDQEAARYVPPTGPLTQEDKERIAQEAYGRSYDQLTSNEQKSVGGIKGGAARAGGSNIEDPASMEMEAKQSTTTERTE
ncbi:hypothetical protein DUNSADRAFT_7644 [Dunaliella salina]|uniref:Uncharacterized protein n=1 Tax=Dunaliella salina TaxID=3046 RepID=A0ABQ7H641_DUNSA|nr:hypothetical protein DUNSADRAFT_7644 [Dunaliella salina]|eukprot:KAF5842330.1 hypothetical protein DUNSADRAFT_7644 [Dunaliella salina]